MNDILGEMRSDEEGHSQKLCGEVYSGYLRVSTQKNHKVQIKGKTLSRKYRGIIGIVIASSAPLGWGGTQNKECCYLKRKA